MHVQRLRNAAGFLFFALAALLSGAAACRSGSVLGSLAAVHSGVLACLYLVRAPVHSSACASDKTGLWLGLIAALLPVVPALERESAWLLLMALPGYALILWSLAFLGRRFGITPADRGLVSAGPYACVRHPMYLGELIVRIALVLNAREPMLAGLLVVALGIVQVLRIRREEGVIAGYSAYRESVRWRLLPYVW